MMIIRKAGLPALVLRAALMLLVFGTLIGCPQEEDYIPPKEGVLTVNGADDSVFWMAEVYKYANDDIADAADLNDIMSLFDLAAIGLGTAGNGTLEIVLQTPDGADFTSDGEFLVVLKDPESASVLVRYMASVPFTVGSATLEYANMAVALVETDDPDVSSYIVTFDLNYTGALSPPKPQKTGEGGTVTKPSPDPTRTGGYTFAGWYKEAACVTPWDFVADTVTADLDLYAKWNPLTFAAAIADMAETANRPSASYTLQNGSEDYSTPVTLTAGTAGANSPASVTIVGGDRTVTGTTYIPLTVGAGVTLTLKNMTFSQIPFKVTAGGKLVLDDGSVIRGNRQHAAPANAQQVSEVTGQFDGTGVYVDGGSLVMTGSSLITDNNHSGVQVFNSGDISGSFTMNGGKISGNSFAYAKFSGSVGWNGAGVGIVRSSFTMTGGEISGNTAQEYYIGSIAIAGGYGGGVSVMGSDAVFIMSGGKISGNTADYNGGGVDLESSATFNMSGTAEISGNTAASGSGGGVNMWLNTTFNMAGGVIKSNEAGREGGGVYASGNGNTRFNMTGGTIGGTALADGNIAGLAPPPTGYTGGFYGGGVYLGNFAGTHMSGNPRVVSRDGAVNGGTGWTGLIEDYTNGSGPGLIQNNSPRNVQFSSDGSPYIP